MPETGANNLADLGWDDAWGSVAQLEGRGEPGRVARVDFGRVTVLTDAGVVRARPGDEPVAVGDWVLIDGARVRRVLPRRSAFVRGDAVDGTARGAQVVAANVDVVFVMQSLKNGPNRRRLERELVLAFESGATPVVVMTKSDLVGTDDVERAIATARASAPGIDAVAVSAQTETGIDELRAHVTHGRTVALIGASGVGKSTLVNRLAGTAVQATAEVRENDQRGRHTTTARELVLLPGGGLLIDTPGLRAVSLWDADEGLSRVFADIEQLAAQCRFRDCSHTSEPECAVNAAIAAGELDRERFEHYLRLNRELDEQARGAR
jgi:ribosome small subunit-dependent GTPase A